MKRRIKKGDQVVVISGSASQAKEESQRSGRVLAIDQKKSRVLVEGVNVRQCARKRTPQAPKSGFENRECFIHISNVVLKEKYDASRKRSNPDASGEE